MKDRERFSAQAGFVEAVELPVLLEFEGPDAVEGAAPFRRSAETGAAPAPRSVSPLLDTAPDPGFGFREVFEGLVEDFEEALAVDTSRIPLFERERAA